jgi:2-oxoglutarate dehydrogenase E2 component (dihydrolipoamide succinyltransferase)
VRAVEDVLVAATRPDTEPKPTSPRVDASVPAAAPHTSAVPSSSSGGPTAGPTVGMSRLRQVVAQRMTDSLQVSAQLTTVQRVDITRIAAPGPREDRYQARQNIKLTYLPFYAKATVEALRAVPQLNASINAESKEVTYDGHVHLAIALDGPQGLLVPVIKNGEIWTSPVWPVESPTWPPAPGPARSVPTSSAEACSRSPMWAPWARCRGTPIINQPQVATLGMDAIVEAVSGHPDRSRSVQRVARENPRWGTDQLRRLINEYKHAANEPQATPTAEL